MNFLTPGVYTFSQLIDEGILLVSDGYRAKNEELGGDGLIFLRAGHVTDSHIDFAGVDRFHTELTQKVSHKMSAPGDVVVTTKGNSTGRVTYVTDSMPSFVYSPHLSFWRSLKPEWVLPGFLRYWSRGREFREQLSGMAGATDMAPYLSLADQRRLRISMPRTSEQSWIVEILGALDQKLDINRRMNQTLEAMARAIFKSWFVGFDPVVGQAQISGSARGMLPEGWTVGELGDIVEVIDCLHSRKPTRRTEGKPLLQLSNIADNGLLDMSDIYLISPDDYEVWTSRMEAREGDCVITNVGRVGAVGQIPPGMSAALGRNMTGLRCRSTFPFPAFLLESLLSSPMREEIDRRTDSGTILDSLNVRSIPRLRMVIPTVPVAREFERVCRPLRAKMEKNLEESRTLAAIRDTLLPKLLSGEIRVKQAEKIIGEVV